MCVAGIPAADTCSVLESKKYGTLSFSSSRSALPVTNLDLAFHQCREHTTMNAIKSKIWRVREARSGDAVSSTTLEQKPIQSARG